MIKNFFLLLTVMIQFIAFAAPANDACANAQTLTPGTACTYTTGTLSGALIEGAAPSCATGSSQDVWYKFTATQPSMTIILNNAAGLNHGFEIYQGSCGSTPWQCVNNNGTGVYEEYFRSNFTVGQQYYVRVFNTSSTLSTSTFEICVRGFAPPANDACTNAQTLTPGTACTYTTGTLSGALIEGAAPSCATGSSQDVWYKFTATQPTMAIVLNNAAGLNHGFEIYQGTCGSTPLQCVNNNGTGVYEEYFRSNFIVGQEYYVRVFNTSLTLAFSNFEICVRGFARPANDTCASAATIIPGTECTYTTGSLSGALMEGAALSCATGSSQDVWYKFTATQPTMAIVLNNAAGLNHGFEIYQATCGSTPLQCVNSNGTGVYEEYFRNNFTVGQEYYVRVFNTSSNLSLSTFEICVRGFAPPANDTCASARTIIPGTECTYTTGSLSGAFVEGVAPSCATESSQDVWFKFTATDVTHAIYLNAVTGLNHGFEIRQGGCSGTLVTCKNDYFTGNVESYFNNNFIVGQEYYIRVFNVAAQLTTASFTICIVKFPTPANDLCANATQLTAGAECTYTAGTFSGTLLDGGAPLCATNASQDAWFKFTATDVTHAIYLNAVTGLNHGFEIRQGGCNGTVVTCKNDYIAGNVESYLNNNFIVGQEYYIRVFNAAAQLTTASFTICIVKFPTPANDLCANATQLTPAATCTYTAGSFSGTLLDGGAPLCATNTSQDAWFKFTATDVTHVIYLNAVAGLNHGLEIRQGGCNGTVIACVNGYIEGNVESYTGNSFIIGQEYYVRVLNVSATLQTRNFGICLIGPPPTACTPSVAITASSASICQGQSITFTATPTNSGTTPVYQWKVGSSNVGTNSPTYTTTTLTNGNIVSVVMTSNAACASVATVTSNTITMNVTAITTPTFTQVASICGGGSFTLPTTSTNGITGTWSPTINNTATTTYTFTPSTGQCAATATMTVSVNSNTTPTFTQVASICHGGSFTLPTTSTNGITGTWSPAVNNTATTTYTFTPNAGQCAATATMAVNVNSNTTPTFIQIASICRGGSFTLQTTSTNGITGTWSPAVNNTATTTYTFTPNAGQCAATATMTVNVNNNTTPTFIQVASICHGGSFTLPTTSTNGLTGTWSPAVNNTATTTYTFTPNAGQCAATATMTVNVNNNTTPTFTQVASICRGGSFTLPTTSTNGITGTWSPAVNNTATTTYAFTPNAGQCAATATMTVNVNNNTIPTFTQVASICRGGSFTLPTTSTNGIAGTWSPSVNNTAITTYTFTPNTGQCAATATMTVNVNNNTTPTFTQVASICRGGSFTLPTTSTNGIIGTWSPAVNNTATTTYTFTPNADQCAATATMAVNVNIVDTTVNVQGATITASATGATYQWIDCVNNQPINEATAISYTPSVNGSYAVMVTQNGCTATSDCITITTAGVDKFEKSGLKIYPNPVIEYLFIDVQNSMEIVITDMMGKTILRKSLQSGQNSIDVSGLSSGVYMINSGSGTHVKFIKK